jgi:hypothetical protein
MRTTRARSAGSCLPGEIKALEKRGIDPEDLKGGKHTGGLDLFKRRDGEIEVRPKDGSGPGDPTG